MSILVLKIKNLNLRSLVNNMPYIIWRGAWIKALSGIKIALYLLVKQKENFTLHQVSRRALFYTPLNFEKVNVIYGPWLKLLIRKAARAQNLGSTCMRNMVTTMKPNLIYNFSVLKKCQNKFDCLIHKILLIKELNKSNLEPANRLHFLTETTFACRDQVQTTNPLIFQTKFQIKFNMLTTTAPCHLNFSALRVISNQFLLVMPMLYKTEWSQELKMWSHKMIWRGAQNKALSDTWCM